ncbi:hypothetical protein FHS18_003356 [Paenibacillus phyllosphaerae]|uniref:Uncharacterized protein n=1 Tax=Paenibacillus phyllosphaerae TaxID=274593 RepID=A0A7W5AYU8_9BACL|nr:hypothetical protein [Paenibacillus phyllosphaerae]MBB3111288.1 hypothetical protein [Paenibacillus phyllosphaerae]
MTKQYAIDKAKIYFRESNRSYFVIQTNPNEYEVIDKPELEKAMAEGGFRRDSIVFSIEGEDE